MNEVRFATIATLCLVVAAGCSSNKKPAEELGRANAPAQAAPQMPAAAAAPATAPKTHQGVIEEVQNVANYSYLKFKTESGEELWAAVIKGDFEPGKPVTVLENVVMKNFHSPTLEKDFETIIFGTVPGAKTPTGHPSAGANNKELPPGHPPVDKSTAPASNDDAKPAADKKPADAAQPTVK